MRGMEVDSRLEEEVECQLLTYKENPVQLFAAGEEGKGERVSVSKGIGDYFSRRVM